MGQNFGSTGQPQPQNPQQQPNGSANPLQTVGQQAPGNGLSHLNQWDKRQSGYPVGPNPGQMFFGGQ